MELIDIGNNEYILRQTTTLKTTEVKFKPNVPVESDQLSPLDGKFNASIVFEGPNKLLQTNLDGPLIRIVREFTDTYLIMVII